MASPLFSGGHVKPVLATGLFALGLAAAASARSDPLKNVVSLKPEANYLNQLGHERAAAGQARQPAAPQGLPSVTIRPAISEARGLVDFDLDGNGGWKVAGDSLVLEKAGVPGGPIRRPAAIAILKSQPLSDLTLDLELKSTAPVDLEVRDVLLIAGYRAPTEFYYVHISRKTDPVHNGIFLVNNADRKRLDVPGPLHR
jgi:hypothetical protein